MRNRPRAGFSLSEMLVVTGILGLRAAIGVGTYARRSEAACVQSAAVSIVWLDRILP